MSDFFKNVLVVQRATNQSLHKRQRWPESQLALMGQCSPVYKCGQGKRKKLMAGLIITKLQEGS